MITHESIVRLIEDFRKRSLRGLKIRCQEMPFDVVNEEIYTVVTTLLARQVTLSTQLASAPQMWNGHSSPLFLRSMADVHITLEWIGAEPLLRAKAYIEHGLGQFKLQMEHWKKSLESDPKNEQLRQLIKKGSEWIDSQYLRVLTNVNVGSWSGKSTRDMAEEVGILDFYNFVYTPFSQCAHSTWVHVGQSTAKRSTSPFHCNRFLPNIVDLPPDVEDLILCVKYLDKTFNFFDAKILKVKPRSALQDWLLSELVQQN